MVTERYFPVLLGRLFTLPSPRFGICLRATITIDVSNVSDCSPMILMGNWHGNVSNDSLSFIIHNSNTLISHCTQAIKLLRFAVEYDLRWGTIYEHIKHSMEKTSHELGVFLSRHSQFKPCAYSAFPCIIA